MEEANEDAPGNGQKEPEGGQDVLEASLEAHSGASVQVAAAEGAGAGAGGSEKATTKGAAEKRNRHGRSPRARWWIIHHVRGRRWKRGGRGGGACMHGCFGLCDLAREFPWINVMINEIVVIR